MKLQYLYSTLQLFVCWIADRVYDFHQVPYAMKADPPDQVLQELEEIPSQYSGTGYWDIGFLKLMSNTAFAGEVIGIWGEPEQAPHLRVFP